uniref:pyridoxal kinase n=1 Tax=Lygus hesperus TaxID=30085 RepID=A0A146LBR3_LYGHE
MKIASTPDAIEAAKKIHKLKVPNVIITSYEVVDDGSAAVAHDLHITEKLHALEVTVANAFADGTLTAVEPCGVLHSLLSVYDGDEEGYRMYDVRMPKYGPYVSGTGDLFTAILCGLLCRGASIKDAWEHALESTQAMLRNTLLRGRSELAFVQTHSRIHEPLLQLTSRSL